MWTRHVEDHHLTPESKAGWFLSVTHLWEPKCGLEQVSLRAVVFAGSCMDLGTHGRSVRWGQGWGQQGKNELPSIGYPLILLRKNRYDSIYPDRWTWVWVSSRSWWWTGKPGVLQAVHGVANSRTRLSYWTELIPDLWLLEKSQDNTGPFGLWGPGLASTSS